jgi:hypothetical protein
MCLGDSKNVQPCEHQNGHCIPPYVSVTLICKTAKPRYVQTIAKQWQHNRVQNKYSVQLTKHNKKTDDLILRKKSQVVIFKIEINNIN